MQRAPGAREPLGALLPGPRPLEGKSFYLDEVKSHLCAVLTKLIIRLGGKLESFLYKEVSVVITGNKDALMDLAASSGKVKGHATAHEQRGGRGDAAQRLGTARVPVCGSRGKALLERAIRNNEQSRGGVLSSAARYWGVKIVSVDQFMKVVEELSSCRSAHTHRRREVKNSSECLSVRVIKAGSLKVDFVKVEDVSRKYRPLHSQSLDFPLLSYTRRFSPFEGPAPAQPGTAKEDEGSKDASRKSAEPISSRDKPPATSSPKTSRKKKRLGYCECCQAKYADQDEHLRSDVHLRFMEDASNYAVVDQLVASMGAVFFGCKDPQLDAPMTTSSRSSVASPSKMEQRCDNELQARESEPARQQGRVCESTALPQEPQEPRADAPSYTSLEFADEKLNLTLNCEVRVPSPHPQDGITLDDKLQELPSPGLGSDVPEPCSLQEHAGICPRLSPSPKTSTHKDRDPSATSRSPERHQEDNVRDLPSRAQLTEGEQTSLVDAASCCPSVHSQMIQDLTVKVLEGVNPRKRSRSFTLSPKASKMRRTNLWSDPTHRSGRVSIGFDHVRGDVTERKPETAQQDPLLNVAAPEKHSSSQNDQPEESVTRTNPRDSACHVSSELGPPQLYPFFHDDVYQNQPPFLDPPKLELVSAPNKASSTSVLSQSFSSVCIESALVPDIFSPASSESDWDSGLLSRLAPAVLLQPKGGRCELDLGLLLQSSCAGVQDGSYASRLCSVLQPTAAAASHAAFGDPSTIYRAVETMDRRIIQSLEV